LKKIIFKKISKSAAKKFEKILKIKIIFKIKKNKKRKNLILKKKN